MSLPSHSSAPLRSRFATKSKTGFLQNMKVSDVMTYGLIAYLVIGSTLGYTSSDSWYLVGTGLGTILGLSSVLTKSYSRKEFTVVAVAFVVSLLVALNARSLTLLLTSVVIAASKGMNIKSLLKFYLVIKCGSFVALILLGTIGVFDIVEVSHYSALVGETISRSSINGAATNILHLSLFSAMILIIAIRRDKLSMLSYVVMLCVNVAFYYFVSYSSGGLIVTTGALVLAMAVHCSKLIRKLVCKCAFLIVPLTIALFVYTGYQYGGTGIIDEFNRLTTGRIAYNHFWLATFGPTFFGVNPAGQPAAFDNSVIYLLVGQGIFAAAAILLGYWVALRRLGKSGNVYILLMVLFFYLFSMSESILPSIVANPSLFVVVDALLPGFYSEESLRGDENSASRVLYNSEELRLA